MYLIIGATGNVGTEIVQQLHHQGYNVRALTRDASRAAHLPKGVEIIVGDLDDVDILTSAARGVEGIFFMQAAPVPYQAENMIQAAHSADVKKVVVLSSIGTRLKPMPTIGARIDARDEVFRNSGLDITYLWPNEFMSNTLWWSSSIRDEGRVVDSTGLGQKPPVDPYDIARVAVLTLTEPGHTDHGYILNGPQAFTARERVEILAEVLGRPIEFVSVTPQEFAQQSIEHGTSPEMAAAIQNLNELFRAGRAGVLTNDIENLTGIAPKTFRGWCERHIEAFR